MQEISLSYFIVWESQEDGAERSEGQGGAFQAVLGGWFGSKEVAAGRWIMSGLERRGGLAGPESGEQGCEQMENTVHSGQIQRGNRENAQVYDVVAPTGEPRRTGRVERTGQRV